MRKEILMVIIIGILIGSIITIGVYTAQTALNKQKSEPQTTETPTATPTQEVASHTLTIIEPPDQSIIEEETMTIVGKTSPNAVIAIIAQDSEYLLTSDNQGDFSAQINLSGGANQITISSFDEQGNKVEKTLTVVYSTAEL